MNITEPKGLTSHPEIYTKVLALLPQERGAKILDVGAGQGYFSQLASEKGYAVEACDFNPNSFRPKDIPFRAVDINEGIPFADETFDVVVSIEVIEHLENHARFMRELLRVTRKGGTIIITTPNVLHIAARWSFFLLGYTSCARNPLDPYSSEHHMQHTNPITLPQLLYLLERFGGELVDVTAERVRKGGLFAMLFPFIFWATKRHLLKEKFRDRQPLHERHLRWMLHPAVLTGRILITASKRLG
jgi:SAM-dependent methyltransferase